MIPKEIGLTTTVDRLDVVVKAVNDLVKQQVLVGIPAEFAERDAKDGDAINNAALGYCMEFGLPERNLPARPHLVPGVKAYAPEAIKRLKAAANSAMDANPKAVTQQLTAIGLEAVVSVKKVITDIIPPPLKPATIAARKRAGFAGETPLIRTSDYLRHINAVIRKVTGR